MEETIADPSKTQMKIGAAALLVLMSLMAIACNNSSDTPPFPPSKGGQVVESKLVKRDSFNEIIAAQEKTGNAAAFQSRWSQRTCTKRWKSLLPDDDSAKIIRVSVVVA